MSDPYQSDPHLDEYVQRLFAGVIARSDRSEMVLARPTEPGPLLLQTPTSLGAVAVALELLEVVRRFGGSSIKSSSLGPLRERLRNAFTDSEWAHLQDELLHTLMWIEGAFDPSSRPVEQDDDGYPVEPRATLVQEALSESRDLYVEFLRRDEGGMLRFHRVRLRPTGLETREGDVDEPELAVVGHIVPSGDTMVLALRKIRWLMVVRRLSPLAETPTARVLTFPGGGDEHE